MQGPPTARPRAAVLVAVAGVAFDILGITGSLVATGIGPGIQVTDRVHHPTAEFAKARATANDALFFQRPW